MNNWFSFNSSNGSFIAYSTTHIITLSIIFLLCILLILCRKSIHSEKSKKIFRYSLAAFIALQQASLYIWYAASGEWSIEAALPLHLCDLSVFLSIAVLLSRKQLLRELLYFWGIAGATQALLTPDIGKDINFPHFLFYQFFISHCVILLVCIYMIAVEKFSPSRKSVLRAFLLTNLYALVVFPINLLTGGNYLFIMWKPDGGSIIDFLGPWPWYLLSLEAVAFILFALLYIPFALKHRKTSKAKIPL